MPEGIDLTKKVISFTRKPARMGRSTIFIIPASYIKNGLIDVNKTYRIYLEESPEEEESASPSE